MIQKPEEPSNTMLMIVGELKGLASDLRNVVGSFNGHLGAYREDKKDLEDRISALEDKEIQRSGSHISLSRICIFLNSAATLYMYWRMIKP